MNFSKIVTGKISFKIIGENVSKLVNTIFRKKIECKNLVNHHDTLTGNCTVASWKLISIECEKLNLEYEIHRHKSIHSVYYFFKNRKGLVLGAVFSLALLIFLSNTFLRLRIKSDNQVINDKIEKYILSCGVDYGDFIPSIDIYGLELNIMQDIPEVSWVGIYVTGGTLNIDLVESTKKPEYNQKRLPSDIVASKDGEIVDARVYGGRLEVPIGSGVHKGQVIVSGEIALSDDLTIYRRSQGEIYAKVLYEEEFFCPYENTEKIVSDIPEEQNVISFFSLDIPLSLKKYEGQYQTKEKKFKLNLLGYSLPLEYKQLNHYYYDFKDVKFSEREAEQKVLELSENFKENFLSETEILEENKEIIKSSEGVTLKMSILVIENIAIEKEILIK